MNWNIYDDEIIFSFVELYNYVSLFLFIKRLVFKVIVKIYDVMGFLLFLIVEMEILF